MSVKYRTLLVGGCLQTEIESQEEIIRTRRTRNQESKILVSNVF